MGSIVFVLIYRILQPYVRSYFQNYLDNLDVHHYLVINCIHFRLHNMQPMLKGILPNMQDLHNRCVLQVLIFVDRGEEKNYL